MARLSSRIALYITVMCAAGVVSAAFVFVEASPMTRELMHLSEIVPNRLAKTNFTLRSMRNVYIHHPKL